jgi:Tfp pilus assembly protein PilO
VVIAFGFFGIRPLWSVLNQKSSLVTEMRSTNKNLSRNLGVLKDVHDDIERAGENLKYLEDYMPELPQVEDFLLDFVVAASSAGFSVDRFTPGAFSTGESLDNQYGIAAKLKGKGDPVKLVNNVEELKRISFVDEIKYAISEKDMSVTIDMSIRIFTSKGIKK